MNEAQLLLLEQATAELQARVDEGLQRILLTEANLEVWRAQLADQRAALDALLPEVVEQEPVVSEPVEEGGTEDE